MTAASIHGSRYRGTGFGITHNSSALGVTFASPKLTTLIGSNLCGTQQHLTDHLGSTSVTANADGTLKSEIRYTAFGEMRSSIGTSDTPYQYTGQLSQMEEIGLYYYGARWMDPAIAHFSQADSIVPGAGNPLAYDRFAYALYNPLRYIDPDGHASVACVDWSDRPGCVAAGKDARDLTNWTVTTAVYIAESKEIQDIRYMLSTEKGLNESESLARLTLAGLEFSGLVSDGSRYDVKDNIKRDIGETIKLNDDWFEYSTPGNIIYGFYGAAAGFGSCDLHLGAGYAQAYDYFVNHEGELGPLYPQLLDTTDDYMAVEFGYQLYTKYYEPDGVLTVEEFQTLLEEYKNEMALRTAPPGFVPRKEDPYTPERFFNQ